MTTNDFLSLAPLMIIAAAPVVIMLTLTLVRNSRVVYGFTLMMFIAAFISLFLVIPETPHPIKPLMIIDRFSVIFLGLIFFISLLVSILSNIYLQNHGGEKEEYFIVLFVASLGASVMVISQHFVSFFIGLETLSISLYIMIAYIKYRQYSIEASIKFLIVASVATAFLLFGMALIYSQSGSLEFTGIAKAFINGNSALLIAGMGMFITGIGFKLALVPFHMWAPDVYQGAPAPVTTFIATISKASVVAVALRFFMQIRAFENETIFTAITIVAIASMFTGNLLALRQNNIKRLLAYSSVAHMGYLLIVLLTGSEKGTQAAVFYIISYAITTIGAFGVISLLSSHHCDEEDLDNFKGMFQRNPWIAFVLSLSMFSLAGIPLTSGFIAKFYLVLEGARSDLWLLVFSLIINTVISLFYYLRVIKTMYTASEDIHPVITPGFSGNIVLIIAMVGILILGLFPSFITAILGNLNI